MMASPARTRRAGRAAARHGLTLIEVAISIFLIAVLLTAMLNVVGAAGLTRARLDERSRAADLAESLLAEILQKDYSDPDQSSSTLGPESGETGPSAFDDVDDYSEWSASPPTDRAGTPIADASGYTQQVVVRWVDARLALASSETGMKFIIVTVSRGGKDAATVSALRTRLGEWRR